VRPYDKEYRIGKGLQGFSQLCDVRVITLTGVVDVDPMWISSSLISGPTGIPLVRDNIRWFSRIRLPMISPRGIRGRVYILINGRLFPLQAVDDFFQIGQQ
jgi:hypothetical protein